MLTVVGIPTCGTVRKARRWLDERGVPYTWRDLREQPPTREEVARWAEALGARAMRNTSGGAWRSLPPEKKTWSDEQLVEAFARDPMLIKRPVILRDGEPVMVGFRGSDEEIARRLGLD